MGFTAGSRRRLGRRAAVGAGRLDAASGARGQPRPHLGGFQSGPTPQRRRAAHRQLGRVRRATSGTHPRAGGRRVVEMDGGDVTPIADPGATTPVEPTRGRRRTSGSPWSPPTGLSAHRRAGRRQRRADRQRHGVHRSGHRRGRADLAGRPARRRNAGAGRGCERQTLDASALAGLDVRSLDISPDGAPVRRHGGHRRRRLGAGRTGRARRRGAASGLVDSRPHRRQRRRARSAVWSDDVRVSYPGRQRRRHPGADGADRRIDRLRRPPGRRALLPDVDTSPAGRRLRGRTP